jgi:hypothetical protein
VVVFKIYYFLCSKKDFLTAICKNKPKMFLNLNNKNKKYVVKLNNLNKKHPFYDFTLRNLKTYNGVKTEKVLP